MWFLPYFWCVLLGVDSLRGGLAKGNAIFSGTFGASKNSVSLGWGGGGGAPKALIIPQFVCIQNEPEVQKCPQTRKKVAPPPPPPRAGLPTLMRVVACWCCLLAPHRREQGCGSDTKRQWPHKRPYLLSGTASQQNPLMGPVVSIICVPTSQVCTVHLPPVRCSRRCAGHQSDAVGGMVSIRGQGQGPHSRG